MSLFSMIPGVGFLFNKWTWILVALAITHGVLGYYSYQYAKNKGEVERMQILAQLDKANLEALRRREADLLATIERYNAAARKAAEQKAVDDQSLAELDAKIEELENALETPDGLCLGTPDTDRLRKLWNQTGP